VDKAANKFKLAGLAETLSKFEGLLVQRLFLNLFRCNESAFGVLLASED
jgi:hypothetical protein